MRDLRFAPPAPPERWRGVRDASRQAPACLQLQPGGVRETQATSEDCLYLDLYHPSRTRRSAELPVVVWVHGGGYTQGTGVIYGGRTLAERTGSVVVGINYRVGALGYLALDQLDTQNPSTGSGNWGLLDQIAALAWVKQNVGAFGGDRGNVTVAGQFAGGSSVCTLLASPKAAGLFQRATIQSACCGLLERPLADAQEQGAAFAEKAGCASGDGQLACLRSAWAPALVSAFQSAGGAGPVVGTPVLPKGSSDAIKDDQWNNVQVLIGSVAHEGKLFLSATPNITAPDYEKWLPRTAPRRPRSPRGIRCPTTGPRSRRSPGLRGQLLVLPVCPDRRPAGDEDEGLPLRVRRPAVADPVRLPAEECGHVQHAVGGTRLSVRLHPGRCACPKGSRRLAGQMQDYWGSFAEDANPNQRGLPQWPRYRATTHQTLVLRPDGPRVSTTVSADHHCDFWADPDAAS